MRYYTLLPSLLFIQFVNLQVNLESFENETSLIDYDSFSENLNRPVNDCSSFTSPYRRNFIKANLIHLESKFSYYEFQYHEST